MFLRDRHGVVAVVLCGGVMLSMSHGAAADRDDEAYGAAGFDRVSALAVMGQLGQDIDGEAAGDNSGLAVAMSADGTRLAIGAPSNHGNGNLLGHVRVFDWDGTTWVQTGADIDGEADRDGSGLAVGMSADGTRLAISAPSNDGNGRNAGHVRVFDWDGTTWIQAGADIDGEAASDGLGSAVAMSADGTRVAIGALNNDGNWSGQVRVFDWDGTAWIQVGADIDGKAIDEFSGSAVSMSADGSRVAIGAVGEPGDIPGLVRVFDWDGTAWIQSGADIDGEATGDDSGDAVSMSADGTRLAIGARFNNNGNGNLSGHVRVFDWDGTAWIQSGADIDGEADGDGLGSSVSMSADGTRVAIGASGNDGNGAGSGHVRIYDWDGTAWIQSGADIDGEGAGDWSGSAVAMSADGTRVAIGAHRNEGTGHDAGHVRVYALATPAPTPNATTDATETTAVSTAAATTPPPPTSPPEAVTPTDGTLPPTGAGTTGIAPAAVVIACGLALVAAVRRRPT